MRLRWLPGDRANQFAGGSRTRRSPALFHGALLRQLSTAAQILLNPFALFLNIGGKPITIFLC
jgi:hypothetical protein